MQGGTSMSDSNEQPEAEGTPADIRGDGEHEAKPETQQGNPTADPNNGAPIPMVDPTEALKRDLAKYRLPAYVKEQIIAQLPSPEKHERLYRELLEKAGLSFEEFFESL